MSERDRMIRGELYDASDPALAARRLEVQRILRVYNELDDDAQPLRDEILRGLLASVGSGCLVQSGFRCEYGFNIELGSRVFMNYDCVVLDVCPVRIGDRCQFGPGSHIYTPTHPLDPDTRAEGTEAGKPVTIENDVWLAGRVTVNPGVTIGRGTTVGAGSVVTRDLPARVFAAGNPARVIREL